MYTSSVRTIRFSMQCECSQAIYDIPSTSCTRICILLPKIYPEGKICGIFKYRRQKLLNTLKKVTILGNLRFTFFAFCSFGLHVPGLFCPAQQVSFPGVTQPVTKNRISPVYDTATAESTVPRKGSWSTARTHGAWRGRRALG